MHSPQAQSVKADSGGFAIGHFEFVALMAAMQALQALAIDVMLPALGHIARDLDVADANRRQLIVGVFLICSGLGSLFPGAIADRFGRKPVVLTCLVAYTAISAACALINDFETLLVLRGLLGVFTAGLMVMPMAIIRDRFSGDRMASTQSLVAMVFMVVPMLAPMLGQGVMLVAGWRWIFGVMAVLATCVLAWVALRLPETLHPEYRQAIRPKVILGNMREALMCREAIGYFVGAACVQGALLGYINSSQQLVGEHFGAALMFPLIFGGMALIMAGTNFTNSRIVERFGARRVSHTALLAYIGLAVFHLTFFAGMGQTLWSFVPLMTASLCLISFIGSNFQSISLQPFAHIAGAASSVMAFVRMVLASIIGSLIGQAYDGTSEPLVWSMLFAGFATFILVLFSERGKLFRRLHYPAGKSPD